MADWQPESNALQQLVEALSRDDTDPNASRLVVTFLAEFTQNVDSFRYLSYVMVQPQIPNLVRSKAGLFLSSRVRVPEVLQTIAQRNDIVFYIKQCAFTAVGDQDAGVRKAGVIVITSLVYADVSHAPDSLQVLLSLVENQTTDPSTAEGAFSGVSNICEDTSSRLKEHPFMQQVIPVLLKHFDNPNPKLRACAIASVNQFVVRDCPALCQNVTAYLEGLYRRANDSEPEIVKHVCQGLVFAVEEFHDLVQDRMKDIILFMLRCCDGGDSKVAVEACEFWLAFAETESFCDFVDPYLGELVRVLLKSMVYSDDDLMKMGPDKDDAHISDRPEDLAPVFHSSRQHNIELTAEQKKQNKQLQKQQSGSADDDDDDLDEDDDDDDGVSEWTLRKCSAAALDVLANIYQDNILPFLLPLLKEALSSQDWRAKEAGILALGAISEGCIRGIEVHLGELVKFLWVCLTDSKPLVRSITCWTLGRYAAWIVYGPDTDPPSPHEAVYFEQTLRGLVHMVLDNNKRVQEAGCSALATLEEVACDRLVPFLPHILHVFNTAFGKYQSKNLRILYDAVGTLADSVGEALNHPEFIPILLQPLIVKWEAVHDDDRDIFPLFECLSAVAIALGPGFAPFAQNVWARCLKLVKDTILKSQAMKTAMANNEPYEQVELDFATVSLDLLSGMIQGLRAGSGELVANSSPPLLDLLAYCINETSPDVRQSAFAVLGDMAIFLFDFVKPHLNQILPITIEQIKRRAAMTDFREMSASNNAIWATGEIALQLGPEIQPIIPSLLPELVHIVRLDQRTFAKGRTLQENSAITIGRLGFVCPNVVAPELEHFALGWCYAVSGMVDNSEKESAFRGMCKMVALNPQGVFSCLPYFCDAIVGWQQPSPELNEEFKTLLVDYKHNKLGVDRWNAVAESFPARLKESLSRRYQI
ncbi:transportin-1 [Zopfochytrium polystomum]|nr:transportin-1 [Zopfochytrium polystomum]